MRRLLVVAVATVVVLGSLAWGGLRWLGGGERVETTATTSSRPAATPAAQVTAPPSTPAPQVATAPPATAQTPAAPPAASPPTPLPPATAPPQAAVTPPTPAPQTPAPQTAAPAQPSPPAAAIPSPPSIPAPPPAPTTQAAQTAAPTPVPTPTPSPAPAPQAASQPAAPASTPPASASPPPAVVASRPAPAVAPPASPLPVSPTAAAPSFDVVRVAPNGNAVLAGRAAPGARVTVKDGDKDLGTATADGRGEWVLVPSAPLKPGGRTLSLGAKLGDGPIVVSEREVVLVVPERQRDIAGQPATQPSQALALSVPRTEGASPSTVLQAPPAQRPSTIAPTPPGQPQSQVTVDVIDYDKTGRVVFSGKAQPEGDIRIYLDNRLVGEVASGSEPWKMTPEGEVPPGNYTLRADLLGPGGRVVARVEMPFQRSAVTPDVLAGGSIVVQPGHSLWRIARQTYGGGVLYTLIYTANAEQIRDPDLIYPGQVFQLPTQPPNSVPNPDRRG